VEVIEFFDKVYRQFPRYWYHPNQDSINPKDFPAPWAKLLEAFSGRQGGTALDLGAGEGSDSIRLARLGFEVDAVEASAIGAEKVERFARSAGVRVNVIHADVRAVTLRNTYDVVICNGLLHYLSSEEKKAVLGKMKECTAEGGYNLVFAFSSYAPIPDCHQLIRVCPDEEHGAILSSYGSWNHRVFFDRAKLDHSHIDFPLHSHSFVKVLARKTTSQSDSGL
jgi:cyclopropane fatty-acyl-phospholipid synthase-like methyltransferase